MILRRWLIFLGAAFLVAVFSLSWAWDDYFASLHPLDLALAERASPVVLDRDGQLLRAFTMSDGRWRLPVTAQDVDPRFIAMLLAYEDHRFYTHRGVDPEALGRAVLQFATRGRIVSGGSTLTMQVARLLEPRKEKSVASKVRQMARALQLESQYAKSIILDLYLGLAPYGGNIEGVRAASLAYFGKEPKRLSVAEAALLVALPQSPEARRPDRFPARARAARDRVLARAYRRGVITLAERDEAMQQDVPHARLAFPHLAPHAAEAALRADKEHGVHHLTLSAAWQALLEQLAREKRAAARSENFGSNPRHRQRDWRNSCPCRRRGLFFRTAQGRDRYDQGVSFAGVGPEAPSSMRSLLNQASRIRRQFLTIGRCISANMRRTISTSASRAQ